MVKVDAPPVNGGARQKLAWLTGIVLTVLVFLAVVSGGVLWAHESKIVVHDTKINAIERFLLRIETKVDRLLERE